MKCYFCHKSERMIPQKWPLKDGRMESQCWLCYIINQKNLKIAIERGLCDDKSQLSVSSTKPTTGSGEIGDGRYSTMKVTKGAVGGSNLKASFVEEKKIASLKIADEGEYVTYPAKKEGDKETTKLVIGVTYEGQTDSDPNRWSMNNKSMNSLIEKWDDDTAVWVGKSVEINLAGEGDYRHIVVDEIRTK